MSTLSQKIALFLTENLIFDWAESESSLDSDRELINLVNRIGMSQQLGHTPKFSSTISKNHPPFKNQFPKHPHF